MVKNLESVFDEIVREAEDRATASAVEFLSSFINEMVGNTAVVRSNSQKLRMFHVLGLAVCALDTSEEEDAIEPWTTLGESLSFCDYDATEGNHVRFRRRVLEAFKIAAQHRGFDVVKLASAVQREQHLGEIRRLRMRLGLSRRAPRFSIPSMSSEDKKFYE